MKKIRRNRKYIKLNIKKRDCLTSGYNIYCAEKWGPLTSPFQKRNNFHTVVNPTL